MALPESLPAAPKALSAAELASWRRRFVRILAGRRIPTGLPASERAAALQALHGVVAGCTPDVLPKRSAVQAALSGPLAAHRERLRALAEEERRRRAHLRLVTAFPTNLHGADLLRAQDELEALLDARPEASAEELSGYLAGRLHQKSRSIRARKEHLERAGREFEAGWLEAIRRLDAEDRRALRHDWAAEATARERARDDFLGILKAEKDLLPFADRLQAHIRERMAALLAQAERPPPRGSGGL
jgi:hypothetical protein